MTPSRFSFSLRRIAGLLPILLGAASALAPAAHGEALNLVTNGDFEQLLVPGSANEFGDRYPSQQVIGWTTSGYNFVFTPGSADSTGSYGEYARLALWGPNNGVMNGLPATSPAGGNFIGMDGAFSVGALSQTINGLVPGRTATVSFYWAGAQQQNFTGDNTEQFEVSLGSENQFTSVYSNTTAGFSGWRHESFTFTPTSSSEVLSFLAIGTPAGVPPFSLLDGVAVTDVPEPATFGMLIVSLAGMAAIVRRKGRNQVAALADRT